MKRGFTLTAAFISLGLILFLPCRGWAEEFPVYEEIKPNVLFWKEIYSRYHSTQGVLHDSYDLSIVYGVLEIEDGWGGATGRRNRSRIDEARKRYRKILLHLAGGNPPLDAEQRRVMALFGPTPEAERLHRAAENIRFQRGLKDRFREGVIRSGAYLEQIKEILRRHGVPEDLAYLPHVESSFNYEAYSRMGAAGIWQFMRGTGKRYLTIDYVLDERRDPIRATQAAARFLLDNHARLGNWPLAITAYNHGAGGVARALAAHGSYPAIFRDYDGRRFGFASRNFYSEFLAARMVAKNAEHYFGPLQLEPERRGYEVTLPGYVPMDKLAAHLRLDVETLRRYNKGLREPVFQGEKYLPRGYRLRVPAEKEVPGLAAALPASILEESQKRSAFYMVRRGDTAGNIARLHGVSLDALVAANQLSSRATIYAGQNLRIPGVDQPRPIRLAAVQLTSAQPEPRPEPRPELKLEPNSEPKPEFTPVAASGHLEVNTAVVSGNLPVEEVWRGQGGELIGRILVEVEETLGHYADWLGVPTRELRRLNNLRFGQAIHLNQRIKIPLHRVGQAEFEERRYEYHKGLEEDFFTAYRVEGVRPYRVRRGDSIWSVSRDEFELPLWLIRKYNPELELDTLSPGDEIKIPVVVADSREQPEKTAYTAAPLIACNRSPGPITC